MSIFKTTKFCSHASTSEDQDDEKTVSPSKVTKDWHHSIPDEIREHFLMQLVAEIGELNVKSEAWKTVKKIELEIYESAETRSEYIDRMAGKLVEFEIDKVQSTKPSFSQSAVSSTSQVSPNLYTEFDSNAGESSEDLFL
jgi:hypothetical protein